MEINIKLFEHFFAQIFIKKEANNYLCPESLESTGKKINSYQIVKKHRSVKTLVKVYIQDDDDKKYVLFKGLDIKTFSRILLEFTNNKLNGKHKYEFENNLIFTISSNENIPFLVINDAVNIDKLTAKILIDKIDYLYRKCEFYELEIEDY